MQAAIRHELPDRLPWSPRIRLWYQSAKLNGNLPKTWRDKSEREIEEELGLISPARDARIFRIGYTGGIKKTTRTDGERTIEEIESPVGKVQTITRQTPELRAMDLPGRVEQYPLRSSDDCRVWEYIFEHMEWQADYESYQAYDQEIGESGLPMVSTGDAPFHQFLIELAGYENAFFFIADEKPRFERLLGVMTEVRREKLWPVIVDSPARFILHGLHFSSQFTPPKLFEKYLLPYYQELSPALHDRDIAIALHADNDTKQILELIEKCHFDLLECFVTSPMVPLTLEEARSRLDDRITLWGCIPSILFSPSVPFDEFCDYFKKLLRTIGTGRSIILGVADNVMPDSDIQRVQWITNYLEKNGVLPLNDSVSS